MLLASSTISVYGLLVQSNNLQCITLKNGMQAHAFLASHNVKATEKWLFVQEHTSAKNKDYTDLYSLKPKNK